MDKQTKTILGVGAIAVALYLILRPKGTKAQMPISTTKESDVSTTYTKEECEKKFASQVTQGAGGLTDEQYFRLKTSSIANCMKQSKPIEVNCPDGKLKCPMNSNRCYSPDDSFDSLEGCTWVS